MSAPDPDSAQRHEPPKRPARKRRPRWRAQLSEIDWYSDKLVQIEEILEQLTAVPVDEEGNPSTRWRPNGNPIAALMLRASDFRAKLDRLLQGRPNVLEGMSLEEIREYLTPVLESWPDPVLELALEVYGLRHRGAVQFESEAGHRSAYVPLTGWCPVDAEEP